jgi:hypothetical protein
LEAPDDELTLRFEAEVLFPQPLLARTEIVPVKPPNETVIFVVLFPEVIVAPEGNVQA